MQVGDSDHDITPLRPGAEDRSVLASVKAATGHSRINTTKRYLRARPAADLAGRFTAAFALAAADAPPAQA